MSCGVVMHEIEMWLARPVRGTAIRRLPELNIAIGTDIGNLRSENQDVVMTSFVSEREDCCFVILLCDGMGGMKDGALCARLAISSFMDKFLELSSESITQRLVLSAVNADKEIYARWGGDGGSTLVAVAIDKMCKASAISVGDSRVYKFVDDNIIKVSNDDTFKDMLRHVKGGDVDFPKGLIQYIGIGRDIDVHVYDVGDYDSIMLTSDGVHYIGEETMEVIMRNSKDKHVGTRRILDVANWLGGHDNASIVHFLKPALPLECKPCGGSVRIWDASGDLVLSRTPFVDGRTPVQQEKAGAGIEQQEKGGQTKKSGGERAKKKRPKSQVKKQDGRNLLDVNDIIIKFE